MCYPIVRCPTCKKYMPVKETAARKFYFIDEYGEKNYIEQLYCPKCGTLVSDEVQCAVCNKPLSIHDTVKSEWWAEGICNECLQKTQFTPKAYKVLYKRRKIDYAMMSGEVFKKDLHQEKQWFQKLRRCMRKHDMRDILIDITLGNTPKYISNSILCADLTEGIRKVKK